MICSGAAVSVILRVAAQVGEPQHGVDPVGDAALDAPGQHPAPGIAAEIGLDQGAGDAGERGALDRQRQARHQPPQLLDLPVREAAGRIGGPGGRDAVHLADHAVAGEALHHRQIVGVARHRAAPRSIGKSAGSPRASCRRSDVPPRLRQMVERALPPFDGDGLVLVRIAPYSCIAAELAGVAEPAEHPALVDRVQRVDDDDGPRHRDAGGDRAFAEAAQQIGLGHAAQAGVGDPGGDVGVALVHAAGPPSPSVRDSARYGQRRDRRLPIRPKRGPISPSPRSRCGRPSASS